MSVLCKHLAQDLQEFVMLDLLTLWYTQELYDYDSLGDIVLVHMRQVLVLSPKLKKEYKWLVVEFNVSYYLMVTEHVYSQNNKVHIFTCIRISNGYRVCW